MTVNQAKEVLGVSKSVIRRYVKDNQIPMHKPYGKREKLIRVSQYIEQLRTDKFFDEADKLEAWLAAQRTP